MMVQDVFFFFWLVNVNMRVVYCSKMICIKGLSFFELHMYLPVTPRSEGRKE